MPVGGRRQHKNEEGSGRSHPCVPLLIIAHRQTGERSSMHELVSEIRWTISSVVDKTLTVGRPIIAHRQAGERSSTLFFPKFSFLYEACSRKS